MADVGFFITSLLAFQVKVSGTLMTGAGVGVLIFDLLVLFVDVWMLYLTIPVGCSHQLFLAQKSLRTRDVEEVDDSYMDENRRAIN